MPWLDKERLVDYLISEGFLDARDLSYQGTLHRGLATAERLEVVAPASLAGPDLDAFARRIAANALAWE